MLVTPLFNYTQQSHLHTFFWRFTHATPEERGIDDTFVPVSPVNTANAEMIKCVRKALSVEETDPLFMVKVSEASDQYRAKYSAFLASPSGPARSFYVSRCFTASHHYPLGRGSRCFSAYDAVSKSIVLLKDIWRVNKYHPEAETYKRLHQASVPNVADVIAFNDVQGERHVAAVASIKSRKHQHYRIVLGQVGRPLKAFDSTHQLTEAVLDAVCTHRRAYEDAKVLHRDVSMGNIILYQNQGWLIDWEIARCVDEDKGPQVPERMGTWQFLSLRVLDNPAVFHQPRDDLESFVYVLLWIAGRYASPNATPAKRAFFLEQFDYEPLGAAFRKERLLHSGRSSLRFCGVKTAPFLKLLGDLAVWLMEAYNTDGDTQDHMLTYELLIPKLTKALDNEVWRSTYDRAFSFPVGYTDRVTSEE
ncbi:hypothetical protein BDP27DRAFT_1419224 [Rhodocollybia butyracea]|uniref:Fungal-type protein kinase domain-containing protein n=1 Tax=Rhodocollybia butyracea TaxID=206335 RepID=A0A9P5PXQ9_9AGAR|nr:hypothetical protein BDP27DRAFT_1419224 [Rhodocollybia butyracea]